MGRTNKKIEKLLKQQIDSKVSDLTWWDSVRWEGGRLYYETQKILNEIADYNIETQILYFDLLAKREFRIYDNAPSKAPEITEQFYNWLKTKKTKLEIIACGGNKEEEKQEIIGSNFLEVFIEGIHELQKQGDKAVCIENIKNNRKLEEPFQYHFKTYFSPLYKDVEIEVPKGNGRIDLSVKDKNGQRRIIEFKGWWNTTKNDIVVQIGKYFTEFEKEGYIFMVNHKKTERIINEYKSIITSNGMNYINESWCSKFYKESDFEYFYSEHLILGKTKRLYHFIFNIY